MHNSQLIVIFLRGAADALNLVVPHAEEDYYKLRPTLGIPHPDQASASEEQRALDLDGFFGLHPALERLLPAKGRKFVPSAMGLGLAFVIPFWNTLSMFAGALIAWILTKATKDLADMYIIPVASGIIAGESLMGVFIALMAASGLM